MAVQTGTGEHSIGRGSPLKGLKAGVNCARMPGVIVAVPADLGHPAVHEFGVIAPVRDMAPQAVLLDGRMGPHVGASFFSMASQAELPGHVPFDLFVRETAVMFMATRALNPPLPDGVVRLPVLIRPDPRMAHIAELGLRGFQVLAGPGVDGMAVVAGYPPLFVSALVPEGQFREVCVAFQAFGGLGPGIFNSFAEDEDAHAAFPALFHVGRSRSMAAFAFVLFGGAARYPFFGMGRHHVGLVMVFMAALADLRADIAAFFGAGIARGKCSPHKDQKGNEHKKG